MIGPNPSTTLPSYDETALCSSAFRVMRSMVNGWLREVSIHRNVYSDFQIVHFYRWVRSSGALLYDPALRRALNNLMRKLFLQLIAEFKRLGANIVYADFNRVILNTNKKNIVDAITYVEYIVQNIRNKELFHSVHLSYLQCWEFLLWMDTANFSGVRCDKLPKGINPANGTQSEETDAMLMEEDDQDEETSLDMNWNIGEQLTTENNCREHFESVLTAFMSKLAEKVSPPKAVAAISHNAFEVVQRMHKNRPSGKASPALEFINAICKILFVNKNIEDEVSHNF